MLPCLFDIGHMLHDTYDFIDDIVNIIRYITNKVMSTS